jgi:outer membrane protein OmpA-like peptidoglycan-associated protein/tetratricopeptide (TPR) repeat protein
MLFFMSAASLLQAQKKEIKKGNDFFERGEYYRALENFQLAEEKGAELSVDVQKRIAHCYYHLNDIDNAFTAFANLESELKGQEDLFIYASTNHKFGFYSGAIEWYEKAKKEGANPIQVNELINSCKWAEDNSQLDPSIRVTPSILFTSGQSFGIQYYKDGVVYSSAPQGDRKNVALDKQGNPFLNLYFSTIVDGELQDGARSFSKNLESDYHVGAISFTSDQKTMYFTKTVRTRRGNDVIKIFSVEYVGNDWVNETELSINSDEYDVAYPAVSPDDKYLYFASNKRGGMGGTDLYVVERRANGSLGEPRNLGREINTYGNERYPVLSQKNELYFASDGHIGFGGLDIFRAEKDASGDWTNVTNLMRPMNSNYDDFGYIIDPNNPERGFLSSNNFGQHKNDIIFVVAPREEESTESSEDAPPIAGLENLIVQDDVPEEPASDAGGDLSAFPAALSTAFTSTFNGTAIEGVQVNLMNAVTGELVGTGVSDANGQLLITIPDNLKTDQQEFEIEMSKGDEYNSKRMIVHIMELQDINNNGLMMTPVFNDAVLDEISGMVIPYRGNQITREGQAILDKLAAFLLSNPNIVVKLNGHTEARGNKFSNLDVSQNIADKAEQYLTGKGVNDQNTIPRGYGERYLLNKCKRGKYCTDNEHLANRRIEVVVWKIRE